MRSGSRAVTASVVSPDTPNPGVELTSAPSTSKSKAVQYHTKSPEELAQEFPASNISLENLQKSSGLEPEVAAEALLRDGRNELAQSKRKNPFVLFLKQFLDPFMVLLALAGLLSLISFLVNTSVKLNLYLALVLFGVVLLTCVLSFWQEQQANKVVEGFKNLLPDECLVIRGGSELHIHAAELVVGDIVPINAGNKAPADLRILLAANLKCDMSSLTGESEHIPISSSSVTTGENEKEAQCHF